MASGAPQPARRACRTCGSTVLVAAGSAALAVCCPACGATVGPEDSAPPAAETARPLGRRHHDSAVGWAVSAGFHAAVLVLLVPMLVRSARPQRPPDRPRGVSVVLPAEAPRIESAAPAPIDAEPLAGALRLEPLPAVPLEAPWRQPWADRAEVGIERLIGLDAGGGDVSGAAESDWATATAGGDGGGFGGGSFFGLEARGRRFVYVVDCSGSMRGAKLDAARAELLRSVGALDRLSSFYTVFFNHTHQAMPAADLLRATEANKRRHAAWARTVVAGGGTNPVPAMRLALSLKPDAVWLLSDGIFKEAAADIIRRANPARRVQIHTLAFYSREGEKILQRIAAENRGKYRFVSPAALGLGGAGK